MTSNFAVFFLSLSDALVFTVVCLMQIGVVLLGSFILLRFLSIGASMTTPIPPRRPEDDIEDKDKRFFIFAPASVLLSLQTEAVARGVDAWRLGGVVIQQWIEAGCPDRIEPRSLPTSETNKPA